MLDKNLFIDIKNWVIIVKGDVKKDISVFSLDLKYCFELFFYLYLGRFEV